jgi:hypothetical protein
MSDSKKSPDYDVETRRVSPLLGGEYYVSTVRVYHTGKEYEDYADTAKESRDKAYDKARRD